MSRHRSCFLRFVATLALFRFFYQRGREKLQKLGQLRKTCSSPHRNNNDHFDYLHKWLWDYLQLILVQKKQNFAIFHGFDWFIRPLLLHKVSFKPRGYLRVAPQPKDGNYVLLHFVHAILKLHQVHFCWSSSILVLTIRWQLQNICWDKTKSEYLQRPINRYVGRSERHFQYH